MTTSNVANVALYPQDTSVWLPIIERLNDGMAMDLLAFIRGRPLTLWPQREAFVSLYEQFPLGISTFDVWFAQLLAMSRVCSMGYYDRN